MQVDRNSGNTTSNVDEVERRQAYLDLLYKLLKSSGRSPEDILSDNPALLDSGLVRIMEQAAVVMEEKSHRAEAQFWRDTATRLKRSLGDSSPVSTTQTEEILSFLIKVLDELRDNWETPQAVYRLLEPNADKLNSEFAQILRVWATLTFLTFPSMSSPIVQAVADMLAILGALIKDFNYGDKANNLEIALASFESALPVYVSSGLLRQWASVLNEMGIVYSNRTCGDQAENVEKAIACYENALRVYTRIEYPQQWAGSQNNMATAYLKRIHGNQEENLKKAIASCENALQVFKPETFPEESTLAQNNLEYARYCLRQGASETKYQVIQQVSTLSTAEQRFLISTLRLVWAEGIKPDVLYPYFQTNSDQLDENFAQLLRTWARTTLATAPARRAKNIAKVLYQFSQLIRDFPLGDRAANLEIAIAGYEIALQVYTTENLRGEWAEVQINLGIAYEESILGDQAEKWEKAIACYENAGQVFTRAETSFPEYWWGWVQDNLGNAYRNRVRGDKGENLERAIAYYENALQARPRETFPREWGTIKHNLASAYVFRLRGDRAENIEKAISLYKEALQVQKREEFPDLWAVTQMSLGTAYNYRLRGEPAQNLQRAIDYYQNSLQIYTAEAFPHQHEQVSSYLRRTEQKLRESANTQSTNLWVTVSPVESVQREHQDLPFLNRVLSSTWHSQGDTQVVYPILEANLDKLNQEFVEMLRELGESLAARELEPSHEDVRAMVLFSDLILLFPNGSRETNLEIAIAGCEFASQPYVRQVLPQIWAMAQSGLGRAYFSRYQHRLGDNAENVEKTLNCYRKALQVFTREAVPELWAAVQHDLGYAYYRRIRGNKAENLEAAIRACQSALEICSREAYPQEWASTQRNLGLVYLDRYKGVEAENLKSALNAFQSALQVFTCQSFAEEWGFCQKNIGYIYADPAFLGNHAENLEKAIEHCQKALEARPRSANPVYWADTQVALGNVYYRRGLLRRTPDATQDFEESIRYFKSALEVYTRESYPDEWASLQHNLGITYSDRINGDKADNLEKAREYLLAALEVHTRERMPHEWADTHRNLAAIYFERILGKREENLEFSIDCCEKALQVFKPENYPTKWATTQWNLGNAYKERSIYDEPVDNLEKAIGCYESALGVLTPSTHQQGWRAIQFSLGTCYKNLGHLGNKDPEPNLEKAIECYRNALSMTDPSVSPYEWADSYNSLGNAYRHRVKGNREENYKEAFVCFQNALQIFTREAFPKDYVKTLGNIGNAHFEIRQLPQAYETFKEAIDTLESMRGEITSGDEAKRKLAEEHNRVYQWMVKVCLELGKIAPQYYADALEYVERSKARNLVELLASRDLAKGQIPAQLWDELQRLRIAITNEQRMLEVAESKARSEHTLFRVANPGLEVSLPDRTRLIQLQQEYDERLTEASAIDPRFNLTPKIEPISFEGMWELLPDDETAIVEWYLLEGDQKFCVFILTRQNPHPIVWQSTPKDLQDLRDWHVEYLMAYHTQKTQWQNHLAEQLKRLAEILHLEETISLLPKACNQLILIPHRFLHLLPLHALPLNRPDQCLLDLFERGVRYAPSCQLLELSQNQLRTDFSSLFAIQNPTEDLPYTDAEVENIRRFFNPAFILASKAATKSEFNGKATTEKLRMVHCFHFSCHGTFKLEAPLESALYLADGEIRLGEIFNIKLNHARLVTLSACETGLTELSSISDEYIGLPSGFLYAGSPGVVSSLWAVNDFSTALLMMKFYEILRQFASPKSGEISIALNKAQKWLRDLTREELDKLPTEFRARIDAAGRDLDIDGFLRVHQRGIKPFAHPFYWAAFTAIGC